MNKRISIILLIFTLALHASSQNFGALPYTDSLANSIDKILTDTVHDKLLVSSRLLNHAGGKRVRGICSWNGSAWDSLAGGVNTHDYPSNPNNPNGIILSGIGYNGKFLAGGLFESIGGINASNIATWDGTHWDSLPVRAFKFLDYGGAVYSFIRYNNKLYLSGYFDSIQGQPANGLATFDGAAFHPVNLPLYPNAYITCMAVYNGELYVAGIFTLLSNTSNRLILKYDGTNWADVGGGVKGSSGFVSSMVVYNNALYVGGYFYKSAGNAGNTIMKWDGYNWHEVAWGDNNDNGAIRTMLLHHNKLYAFGTFNSSGDKKASKVAVYDGQKWCTYSDSLDNNIQAAAVYHDSIYISGAFKTINGDSSLRLVTKFIHPENINDCGAVGIKENAQDNDPIKLYPNPAMNELYIDGMPQNTPFSIVNVLGQTILSGKLLDTRVMLNISDYAPEVYYLHINYATGQKVIKFTKE